RLVFVVIMPSVYQTERPFSNLTSGPKIGVHFTDASQRSTSALVFCLIRPRRRARRPRACVFLTSKKPHRMLAMESGDIDKLVQYPRLLPAIRRLWL
ncbi:hypothetical protein, partial [Bradyrhizobium sp. th.b2]|uniref:hypothetical protein n=1 Tax=Bradyrhizobium sp. th-b2 TaxID=172088 RepID=UPI001AEBDE60